MCKMMEDMRNETATAVRFDERLESIRNVISSFGVEEEEAMDALKIPQSEREKLREVLRA